MTSETAIKKQIRDWLKINGWFAFPILQGMGTHKGISDIIAIKNQIVLFIEVKTENGKQSENQKEFEKNISDQGGYYFIARSYEDVGNYIRHFFGEV